MSDAVARVADAARDAGATVAVAESLTCGLLASEIGKGPDTETWFAGGVVAYQTQTKERVLGVTQGMDPVSAQCAEELAAGARRLLNADIAVSTTGVGGPGPQGGHPEGTVFLGWATPEGTGHRRLSVEGDPGEVLARTVEEAMALLGSLLERVEAR